MKRINYLNPYERKYKKLKKCFIIFGVISIILIGGLGFYCYQNYDYFVCKHLISQNYIYTDALDKLYKKELGNDVQGQYYKYFDNVVISVLTRELRELKKDPYTYQYLPQHYQEHKKNEKTKASNTYYKELDNNILYIKLTNFSKYTYDFFADNKDKFSNHDNLILDLRNNGGGTTDSLYKICDMFLPKDKIISTDITRFKFFTNVVKSKHKSSFHFENIVILQNKNSASSSENMIVALKDNLENVTLIGETTFGKGIGQTTLNLKRGFALKATTMLWNTPNDKNIQGKGIKADIEHSTDDSIIDYALEYIK